MRRLLPLVLLALALLAPTLSAQAQSAEPVPIVGRVVHGVEGADFDPTEVRVTLNVLEGVTSLAQHSVTPDADGLFGFEVAFVPSGTFFFTVEYQGAAYSETRGPSSLDEPLVVTVYDSTHDTSVLAVESYTVIVTGAVPEEGFVEILERAIVRNDSGLTLVPDQAAQGPAMLSFLRFALPPNAHNLDVRSNLVGGQVLEVDRGFALTTPILPTTGEPHQFEFVYRLDYAEADPNLDLSRTMRFGAESFRFVTPVDVASPASPRLADLGATELNGRLLRLLEGQDIEPAEFIELSVSGLPVRSFLDRARDAAGDWYVLYAVPAAVALVGGVIVLLVSTRRRRPASADVSPREGLLAEAQSLAKAYDSHAIDKAAYRRRARAIREALVSLDVEQRLRETGGKGRRDS